MTEFVDFLEEVFRQFGDVQARKMFSGYGLYHDGVMFGLVADETLYLKADASIAHYFEAKGLGQFAYSRGGKIIKMSYYLAPCGTRPRLSLPPCLARSRVWQSRAKRQVPI